MRRLSMISLAVCAGLAFASAASAQQQPPEYGMPINQADAMKVAAAAQKKATEIHQRVIISIVGPSGDLIYFTKMDGAQYASIAISQQKAKTAAIFRRPTAVWEKVIGKGGHTITLLTLPGVIASAGGIPLTENGKVVGAIGVSGGPNGTIDAQAAQAGADALK
jgi:glc operon protein GlcG